ncbi:MAG: helix-turn-helix domain-containing protein [Polaromonas sp.]
MSEFDGRGPDSAAMPQPASVHDDAPAAAGTAGSLIRQAREAAGLHIAALAVALKVPVKKLEALEADRLDLLPDAVFVRALASSVCRTLKIDAAEVLALLPQTGKPRLDYQHASINTPFRAPSDGPGPSLLAQVSRPAVLAGLLLLLGALVLIFLPAVQQQNISVQPVAQPVPALASTATQPVAATPLAGAPTQDTPPATGSDNPAAAAAPADAALAAPVMASGMAVVPAAAVAQAAAPAPALPAASAPAPVAATGIIVFSAKGESWVEVTDAKGVVVLRRTLAAGEAAGASGALPLAAVVGRVDATQVQVRGRPFDLGPVSKDNVARFEVK